MRSTHRATQASDLPSLFGHHDGPFHAQHHRAPKALSWHLGSACGRCCARVRACLRADLATGHGHRGRPRAGRVRNRLVGRCAPRCIALAGQRIWRADPARSGHAAACRSHRARRFSDRRLQQRGLLGRPDGARLCDQQPAQLPPRRPAHPCRNGLAAGQQSPRRSAQRRQRHGGRHQRAGWPGEPAREAAARCATLERALGLAVPRQCCGWVGLEHAPGR